MDKFFNTIAKLFPQMSEKQKRGVINVTNATRHLPLKQRAYLLATTYHETAATMQPITEYGGRRYFDKYDVGQLALNLGNTPQADGDGFFYRGRGYVQITGRANYEKAGRLLKVDLVNKPDMALDPVIAAQILIKGSVDGWFTGRKLSHYINDTTTDYINARRVINGTDKAKLIASYADVFEEALEVL